MKIKKRLAAAALAVLLAVAAVPSAVMAEEKLTKVTLNEVAHSVFYAPQYVALEKVLPRQNVNASISLAQMNVRLYFQKAKVS